MKNYIEYMESELRSIAYMIINSICILTVIILIIGFIANDTYFISLGIFNTIVTLFLLLWIKLVDWLNERMKK